jgi:hypothetical protein
VNSAPSARITGNQIEAITFDANTTVATAANLEQVTAMDIDVEGEIMEIDAEDDFVHPGAFVIILFLTMSANNILKLNDDTLKQIRRFRRNLNRRQFDFQEGDWDQMPMVIYGAGMMGGGLVHFSGHMPGVTGKIYRQPQVREGRGELCLLLIDEFRTSM